VDLSQQLADTLHRHCLALDRATLELEDAVLRRVDVKGDGASIGERPLCFLSSRRGFGSDIAEAIRPFVEKERGLIRY
jgi:hypothetical protein